MQRLMKKNQHTIPTMKVADRMDGGRIKICEMTIVGVSSSNRIGNWMGALLTTNNVHGRYIKNAPNALRDCDILK